MPAGHPDAAHIDVVTTQVQHQAHTYFLSETPVLGTGTMQGFSLFVHSRAARSIRKIKVWAHTMLSENPTLWL